MSQLLDPTFTVVLPSNVVLRDHEPALSREIHIPVFGPRDVEIVPSGFFQDPADSQTPIGFIVYKTEYARDQDASTVWIQAVRKEVTSAQQRHEKLLIQIS
ncbi:hypothetical protein K443DRAFT_122423 [Laccaria amethystina LaAM-08-1]|uniref:Uncharacterized protein n=1 Tax=Laccaria amethystina LaAM-08-1 TaxID=1095629 RepID=A0A0C9XIJ1_9AGAR|nr:hypothetical protein K443DRAFT_122423 [Laccaria amethystina LaAM-08-1]